MKSLEIANELYDDVKELCDYYIAGRWNDKKEIFSVKVNNAMFDLIKSIQKDKQDLEVLEIIRNKKVDLQGLSYLLNEYKDAELAYILNQYNPTEYYTMHSRGCLTLEELIKLKQWLEENENETVL